ncbi:MAG TPA: hypothetical protein VMX14_06105 [Anaerolineae bacterium]|nr:hypothetical protein [Anaerolineae bacterium]
MPRKTIVVTPLPSALERKLVEFMLRRPPAIRWSNGQGDLCWPAQWIEDAMSTVKDRTELAHQTLATVGRWIAAGWYEPDVPETALLQGHLTPDGRATLAEKHELTPPVFEQPWLMIDNRP